MTNLTDKWKKGELPEGDYWVKHDGVINILDNYEAHLTEVEEVLAELPSYDLWKSLNENMDSVMQTNKALAKWCEEFNALDVAKENTKLKTENKWYSEQLNEAVKEIGQLKELLKECRDEVKDYIDIPSNKKTFSSIITKINQVLGEE